LPHSNRTGGAMRLFLSSRSLCRIARTNGIAGLRIDQLDVHVAGFGVQPVAK
jgi:hypothetical protein